MQVAASAEYIENVLELEMKRRYHIGKLAAVLKLRIRELAGGRGIIGLENMKSLKSYMKQIIVTDAVFPISNIDADSILGVPPIEDTLIPQYDEEYDDEEEEDVGGRVSAGGRISNNGGRTSVPGARPPPPTSGTLRGRPTDVKPGDRLLTIFVEKWGFKELAYFTQPQVVISVRGPNGEVIEMMQETPFGKKNTGTGAASNPNYCYFEVPVHIQTPLNKMGRKVAIFFEFRHFKADKNYKSIKCYSFMEMDEIRAGPIALEVYKKPTVFNTDVNHKLLSVKPYYCHLNLSIETIPS